MKVAELTENAQSTEFYPTPQDLIDRMLSGIDWGLIKTVLEPSAGKGDLALAIHDRSQSHRYRDTSVDIDCIEIDQNLRHILAGEGLRVVHDNFLTYDALKQYDLIVMNPPFSEGDKHLLKALDLQKHGGSIVCLLNAETIRNPFSYTRQQLVKALEEYGAKVEFIPNAFTGAERKTGVEVALVKVTVPREDQESEIYSRLRKAAEAKEQQHSSTEIVSADYIQMAIQQFSLEAKAGIELIRQYNAMIPHMLNSLDPNDKYSRPILYLKLDADRGYSSVSVNDYLKKLRYKYWEALLANPQFMRKLTSNLQEKYRGMARDLSEYDFSEYNVRTLMLQMNTEIAGGIKDTIMALFDRLTEEHSWYPECQNNRHYYDGWAHNKAHKINKKVIIPCYGVFSDKRWGAQRLDRRVAISTLEDIEKCLNYLDGGMTREVNLHKVIESLDEYDPGKNIECKYFKVTFYKKGTCHIVFTNLDLLEKFNIYAAQNRKWLPPCYGSRRYADMDEEERAVIDSFQGANAYARVMAGASYYLGGEGLPALTA